MSTPTIIHGPEDLIPGTLYHHAGLRGILYFATASYWVEPGTEERSPQPGTEQLYALNGDLPGALVLSPEDGSNPEFWSGFYPAPGLLIVEHILDGLNNVLGQLKVLENETHEPEIGALADTVIGTVQRVAQTVVQLGHRDYGEARPIEIQAKDRTIGLLGDHINALVAGLGHVAKMAVDLANSVPQGTRTFDVAGAIANEAARLTYTSAFHPGE